MLLHGKSVMSLLLSIVGRGPPSGLGTGCCFVPSLAAERRDERETGMALLFTLGQMFSIYIHDTDIGVKRTSYSWEQAVCFSAYLGCSDSSHCLPLCLGVILTAPCIERVTPP